MDKLIICIGIVAVGILAYYLYILLKGDER